MSAAFARRGTWFPLIFALALLLCLSAVAPALAEASDTESQIGIIALEVSRSIQPEVVRNRGTVVVSYKLHNTGSVRLTDIQIRESKTIATAPKTVAVLEPDEAVEIQFTRSNVTVHLESRGIIEYSADKVQTRMLQQMEPVSIPLARVGFRVNLQADSSAIMIGDMVKLKLHLKNEGNFDYTSIKISDPKLGQVFDELQLPAGQEVTLETEIAPVAPRSYKFLLEMVDNTGKSQRDYTNEVEIIAYDERQVMRLDVQITPDREYVDELPGVIVLELQVTNNSSYTANHLEVYAGDQHIASIPVLKAGESTTLRNNYRIHNAGKLSLTVHAVDALNVSQSFPSNVVNIGFGPPSAQPVPQQNSSLMYGAGMMLGTIMGISLLLFLAVVW